MYGIASAALVHSIARACSLGVTTKCSCGTLPNQPPDGQHKWGGCSDNVRYGLYLTQTFSEASLMRKGKPKKSKKADMNRHNNGAGAKVTVVPRSGFNNIYLGFHFNSDSLFVSSFVFVFFYLHFI